MSITTECPKCHAKYGNIKDEFAGKTATCKKCGAKFQVKPVEQARPAEPMETVAYEPQATVAFDEHVGETVAFEEPIGETVAFESPVGETVMVEQPVGETIAFESPVRETVEIQPHTETPDQPQQTVLAEPSQTFGFHHYGATGPVTAGVTVEIQPEPDFLAEANATFDLGLEQVGETIVADHAPSFAQPTETEADVPADWKIGDVILDLYEVNGLLGEGGMGKVYKVLHRNWNVELAVKSPKPEQIARAGGVENFEREAETWVNLGLHPNTVSCYYVRRLGGIPRVFAEYIDGGSLGDWIHGRKLDSIDKILDAAIQFAWGLGYAHERGLVHQDVKPANVMMTRDGVAKVTDFGLAKARAESFFGENPAEAKDILVSVGGMTPAYCSPEQSERKRLSPKSDMWSWAASVLEIFEGEVTWRHGTAVGAALDMYLTGNEIKPGIPRMPEQVAELLRICLEKEPEARPQSMTEIADALAEIYAEIIGDVYPRRKPKAGKAMADSLNNRAISFLDLGRRQEAANLWESALKSEPHHPESTYNRGITLWRAGRITDRDMVKQMTESVKSHPSEWHARYLLAQALAESDDCQGAIDMIAAVEGRDADQPEIATFLRSLQERMPVARGFVREFAGHKGAVTCVRVTHSGKSAVTAGDDGTIRLWDINTGEMIRKIEGAAGSITSVDIAPDERFAIYSGYKTVTIADLEKGSVARELPGHTDWVTSVFFISNGKRAVSSGWDGTMKIWNTDSGECERTLQGHIGYIAPIPGGNHVIAGWSDLTMKIWDVETGDLVMELPGAPCPVCVSGDGKRAISVGYDNTLKFWDIQAGKVMRQLEGHRENVTSVSLAQDGRLAISASYDETVRLWDTATGRCLRTFEGHKDGVTCVTFTKDGRYAVSAGHDGTARLWRVESGAPWLAPITLCRIQASETVLSASDAYEGKLTMVRHAIALGDNFTAMRQIKEARNQPGFSRGEEAMDAWSDLYIQLPRKGLAGGWESRSLVGHEGDVTSVAMSMDGRRSVTGGLDRTVRLWETTSGQMTRNFEGHSDRVNAVDFSRDGKYIISGAGDWTLRMWDTETGYCTKVFEGHGGAVNSVAMSADGNFIVSCGHDDTVRLWGVESGRLARTFNGHAGAVRCVAISADGRVIISASADGTTRVWDPLTGDSIGLFDEHIGSINSVCLNHDGAFALTGGADGTLRLWVMGTPDSAKTIDCGAPINSTSLSLDGKYAVTAHPGGVIKLWELQTARQLRVFEGHTADANSVAISLNGKYCLSGGADKTARVWLLDWELGEIADTQWDAGAEPFITVFLTTQTSFSGRLAEGRDSFENEIRAAFTRSGKPEWDEKDFERLVYILGCAGYGWINRDEIQRRLRNIAETWDNPPAIPIMDIAQTMRKTLIKPAYRDELILDHTIARPDEALSQQEKKHSSLLDWMKGLTERRKRD